ncbi:MAG: hypothetical protein Q3966_10150 [Neisseria sp.]|nr:hypothetical protein [Neisseria sp.]
MRNILLLLAAALPLAAYADNQGLSSDTMSAIAAMNEAQRDALGHKLAERAWQNVAGQSGNIRSIRYRESDNTIIFSAVVGKTSRTKQSIDAEGREIICGDAVLRDLMQAGYNMEYRFSNRGGKLMHAVKIRTQDCGR